MLRQISIIFILLINLFLTTYALTANSCRSLYVYFLFYSSVMEKETAQYYCRAICGGVRLHYLAGDPIFEPLSQQKQYPVYF